MAKKKEEEERKAKEKAEQERADALKADLEKVLEETMVPDVPSLSKDESSESKEDSSPKKSVKFSPQVAKEFAITKMGKKTCLGSIC